MLFNSYEFIFLFLPITISGYFFLAKMKYAKVATGWLVCASLIFYSYWNILYLPLLLFSILFNFVVGRLIEKRREKRKSLLVFGIVIDLSLLGYFKYTGFIMSSINEAFLTSFTVPVIILPLGISFFTFTQIAYLIDAYRGETRGYSLLTYSLFVTIFPHLIAGPILDHKDMIPQFSKLRNFVINYKNMALGIFMFSIGLFKKVIIADSLAPFAKLAFDHPEQLTFIGAWGGALAYTFQLYFDFSGYSEMAIGLGLMLNFNLPINFNSPYKSTSVIEFWRRWHMTLSSFLKNYLYIPLGGNQYGEIKKMRNLLVTMLLGGLWHGASWNFVIWGGLHGLYLVVNHQWRKYGVALPKIMNLGITFFCIVVAWVFFRAENIHDAITIIKAMFGIKGIVLSQEAMHDLPKRMLMLSLLIVFLCPNANEIGQKIKPTYKWLVVTVTLISYAILNMNNISEFLYFQF